MINIKIKKNNKVELVFNTKYGVKNKKMDYKPLKVIEDKEGQFKSLDGQKSYSISGNRGEYAYTCLYNTKYNKENLYLNTVLQLDTDFINELEFPKLVFYDLETNEYATVKTKNNKISNKARINSIAWISDDNKKYCLVRGIDGNEKEIITQFVEYLHKNNIMGLVGHNSFKFDNKVLGSRLNALDIKHKGINKIVYNSCNLDTMALADFLQYSNSEYISLNELANKLGLEESKTDTGTFNPVTLYNEALEDDEKLKLFREYNIQDVRLTKAVFEAMGAVKQLTDLFNQTLCPLNKVQFNQELLNSYTCKEALSRKIVIPYVDNPKISFKNEGGLNYFEDTEKLNVYHNVAVMDIVSYYPHLLMLIGADNTYNYPNIDKKTGKIKKFEKVPNGLLSQLARELYYSRAEIKTKMKATQDKELKEKLNKEQQTKKIIVNSLYGVLNVRKNGYYVLKSDLIASTITSIGRDLLNHVVENFNGVFAKTDSVFIVLENKEDSKQLLNKLNDYINEFLKSKYNLNNFYNNEQLIKFEIDSILDYLIVKDKNDYIKIANDIYKYKGGSFTNSKYSQYDKDMINYLATSVVKGKDTDTIIEDIITFTKEKISTESLNYFAETTKLSYKQKDNKIMAGRLFMEQNNIPYTWNFKYNYCRVRNNYKFDYVMFPIGYKTKDLFINDSFVYDCLIKILKQFKLIEGKDIKKLKERLNIKEAKKIIIDNNQNTLDNTYIHENKEDNVKNNTYISVKDVLTEIYTDKFLRVNYYKLTTPKVFKTIDDVISYKNDGIKKPKFITTYSFLDTERKELDKFNNIYIDFDTNSKETGFEDAFNEAIKTANFLKEQFNIDAILNASGSKGVHIYVLFNPISVKNPTQVLKSLGDYLINELDLNTLDTAVLSSHKRLERIPTSKHDKTGLYGNFFNIDNTYNEVLENMKHKETKILPYKVNRTVNTENRLKQFLLGLDKEQENEITEKSKYLIKKPKKLKTLTENEIKNISKSFSSLLRNADENNSKYNVSFAMGGFFANHLKKEQVSIICDTVIKTVGYLMRDTELFKNAVLNNYDSDIENKVGLPTVKKYLDKSTKINKHIKNIYNICTSTVVKQSEIYEMEKYNINYGSFAKYSKEIQYNISNEFLSAMNKELRELHKLCKDFKFNNLTLASILCGGFYHYGLNNNNIKKIIKYSNINDFTEYAKNDNLVIKEGINEVVYGFPTLKKEMRIKEDDKIQVIKIINNIKKLLEKAVNINPFFYAVGENNEFKQYFSQFKKQSKNGLQTCLNCAFTEITKYKLTGFINNKTIATNTYDFTIRHKNGAIKTLESYTITDLFDYLKKQNLYMNFTESKIQTDIKTFINEVENRGDIKYKKIGYIEGFLLVKTKNGFKLTYNLPKLNFNTKHTIEDGINELNTIYEDVFNSDTKFVSCFNWYLIHSLRGLYTQYNILNEIVRQLIQSGVEGTGKSAKLIVCEYLFTSEVITEIGNEADSIASINRVAGNSTLPLILDDPTFKIKDIYPITNKIVFTTKGSAKASDQYGYGVNEYDVTRQIVINTNDPIPPKEGFNRRNLLLNYTDNSKLTQKNIDVLGKHSRNDGTGIKLFKLNAIGIEFVKWLEKRVPTINIEDINNMVNTKGISLINEFYAHINSISKTQLHEDFTGINNYKFNILESDYRLEFYDRFKYYLTQGKDYDLTKINMEDLNIMISNSSFINLELNKKENIKKVIIEWSGLEEFIKSSYGLNVVMDKETLYKTLLLPENLKFKNGKIRGVSKRNILKLSIYEFYEYFLNSFVIND